MSAGRYLQREADSAESAGRGQLAGRHVGVIMFPELGDATCPGCGLCMYVTEAGLVGRYPSGTDCGGLWASEGLENPASPECLSMTRLPRWR
jgi:hypothetical protein